MKKTRMGRRSKKPSRVYRKRRSLPPYQPELKHLDRYNTFNLSQSGNLVTLSDVTVKGTDDTQRIGDNVHGFSVYLRFSLIRSASSDYDNIRFIIFQDMMGTNIPSVNQILEPAYVSTAFAPFASKNHFYLSRFRIFMDRTVSMSVNTGIVKNFKLYRKLNGLKVEFIGGSTFKNQVYLLVIADTPNLLALPQIRYTSRFVYYD